MAVSPDGKYVLASGLDRSVALWDLRARKLVWQCHIRDNDQTVERARIPSGAFLPGGRLIAVWGEVISSGLKGGEATLRLVEAATGKEARSFAINRWVRCVTVSADGKYLLAGGEGSPLKLWRMADGKEIRTFQGGQNTSSLALSADGKFALSGESGRAHVKLWDVATGKELWAAEGHTCWVRVVAFSPDGKHGLSAGDDAYVRIWDLGSGRLVRSIWVGPEHKKWGSSVDSAAFTVSGRYVVVAAAHERRLRLWEVATGTLALTFQAEDSLRAPVVPTPDGRHVLAPSGTCWAGSLIFMWDMRSGEKVGSVVEPANP